jgi:hypothetical protein
MREKSPVNILVLYEQCGRWNCGRCERRTYGNIPAFSEAFMERTNLYHSLLGPKITRIQKKKDILTVTLYSSVW